MMGGKNPRGLSGAVIRLLLPVAEISGGSSSLAELVAVLRVGRRFRTGKQDRAEGWEGAKG